MHHVSKPNSDPTLHQFYDLDNHRVVWISQLRVWRPNTVINSSPAADDFADDDWEDPYLYLGDDIPEGFHIEECKYWDYEFTRLLPPTTRVWRTSLRPLPQLPDYSPPTHTQEHPAFPVPETVHNPDAMDLDVPTAPATSSHTTVELPASTS